LAFSARLRQILSGKRGVGHALPDDALDCADESAKVGVLALVETVALLIEVTE
jgi:hypothetical protein